MTASVTIMQQELSKTLVNTFAVMMAASRAASKASAEQPSMTAKQ